VALSRARSFENVRVQIVGGKRKTKNVVWKDVL